MTAAARILVPATLTRARAQAQRAGLHHVYTGNVRDPGGQSSYCAACGERLIQRDGYRLGRWRLDARGRCARCRTPLAGRFASGPGHWGPRRQPIVISRPRGDEPGDEPHDR